MCPICGCKAIIKWRDGKYDRFECVLCKHIWTAESGVYIFEVILACVFVILVFGGLAVYIVIS